MTATITFFVTLAIMAGMIISKAISNSKGINGFLSSYLGRFDPALSRIITRASVTFRFLTLRAVQLTSAFLHNVHLVFAAYTHLFVQGIERRVRSWREFAREQKIERKSASVFIQDVVDYKTQLKQRHSKA